MNKRRTIILLSMTLILLTVQAISPLDIKFTNPELDKNRDTIDNVDMITNPIEEPRSSDSIRSYTLVTNPLMEEFDQNYNPSMWETSYTAPAFMEVNTQEGYMYMQAGKTPVYDLGLPEDVYASTKNVIRRRDYR